MGRRVVKMYNILTRLRGTRCKPERVLLLFSSCLQRSMCPQKVTSDLANCLRCGKCKVKDVLELAEKHGCQCAIATGGGLALQIARGPGVDAIVAIACEKELQAGIAGTFPKPGFAVINLRPHGPCKDTDVDLQEVEKALQRLLHKGSRGNKER